MADVNYAVPVITAGAVVISAGIGFLAAALKHKWDVQDDDARWERNAQSVDVTNSGQPFPPTSQQGGSLICLTEPGRA